MSFSRFISHPPVDVYPLLGAVSVACGFGVMMGYKTLTQTQDIIINKSAKTSWQSDQKYCMPSYSTFLHSNYLPAKVTAMRKPEIKYEH